MRLNNVKELKDFISDLPDDMILEGYDGTDKTNFIIRTHIITEDTLDQDEIEDGYPNGVTPTLVIELN